MTNTLLESIEAATSAAGRSTAVARATPAGAARSADAATPLPDLSSLMPGLPAAEVIGQQLDAVEREMDSLRQEVELLRRRDHTVNFHMQRIDEELRLAARLQQEFLPKAMARLGPVEFHALWRPAGYVSGDMYDVVRLDETHVGFYIADAVGHGVPAALLTMFIKHALVTKEINDQTYRLLDAGQTLARLNDSLSRQNLTTGTFCTACYAVLHLETLVLEVASAGHPPPILLRGDEPPRHIKVDGSLLGIFEGEQYQARTVQLQPGDRLLLYTDGVEVAFSNDSQTPSPDGFNDQLFKRRMHGGEVLISELARYLDFEIGSLNPRDDLTLLVAEIA